MTEVAEQLDVLLEKERAEKAAEQQAKEQQKAALLRFRIAVGALVLGALAVAVVLYGKRETLRLANELEQARNEGAASFDKLDTCVASHKIASSEAAACKAARDRDQAEFQRSLEAISKKGATGDDKLRDLQVMVGSYAGRLKVCEDGATAAAKTCVEDQNRQIALAEKEKAALTTARDEQKTLAEAREKELATVKSERDACSSERSSCQQDKAACVDQKAQILIACAGVPAKSGGGAAGASTSAAGTGTGTAPATTAPAATGSTVPAATADAPPPPPAPTPTPAPVPAPAPT